MGNNGIKIIEQIESMNKLRGTLIIILGVVEDLVADFLYYDRKEDEDLPRGVIQKAIKDGSITQEQIIKKFAESLNKGLNE